MRIWGRRVGRANELYLRCRTALCPWNSPSRMRDISETEGDEDRGKRGGEERGGEERE